MKTLYIDCGMGAAGDMLVAALLELIDNKEEFINKVNNLGIPNVHVESLLAEKCGIMGTQINVLVSGEEEESIDVIDDDPYSQADRDPHFHPEHDVFHSHNGHVHSHSEAGHSHSHEGEDHSHEDSHTHHHHGSMEEIEHIVRGHLNLSTVVQDDILGVFNLVAEAESLAHGVPVSQVHFHEVGSMDAIADITMVAMLMEELDVEEVVVSPIHVGSGHVKCAHGILPVPAPATAYILKDVPIYGGAIKGELCTPTGAALLKHFATRFGNMPVMKVHKIGYGMGKKDFDRANTVRVSLGETSSSQEDVLELSCNIDDMTPEVTSFAIEMFFEAGALEVYTMPIGMKKSRTGILLTVMCKEGIKDKMLELIFKHTTTIGVRENISRRHTLNRTVSKVETPYGEVDVKISEGFGVKKEKYEYEDLAKIARENNLSIFEVIKSINNIDK